jgi:topoisomerase-4 subunit A
MTLAKNEKPLAPAKVVGDTVAAVSASGRLLMFPLAELKAMPRGRGLIVLDLAPKDEMAAVAVGSDVFVISGPGRGGKPAECRIAGKQVADYRAGRAKKGQPLPTKLKPAALSVPPRPGTP